MSKNSIKKENVGDILPLSHIQEGILYHCLMNNNKEQYFQQLVLTIEEPFSYEIFEKAFHEVIKKNEMLRTVFNWNKTEKPFQIVLKHFIPSIKYMEIIANENSCREFEDILLRDRRSGLDLYNNPYRVLICKINENQYKVVFSYHHILFDGWSTGIIIDELMDAYDAILKGKIVQSRIKSKYKDYLQFLTNINMKDGKKYWKDKLIQYKSKEYIGKDYFRSTDKNINVGKLDKHLDYDIYQAINTYIKKENVTLASFLYSVWAILLSKYSGYSDILFGTTISGRDIPINFIENSVGLYINTIPLRIKVESEDTPSKLIKNVSAELNSRRFAENIPLVDIKSCIDNAEENFFDSIVVIENYPINSALKSESSLKLSSYNMYENTNYPLVLEIITFDGIQISINYSKNVFSEERIGNILNHLTILIDQILKSQGDSIKNSDFMSTQEKEYVTYELNVNEQKFPEEETVVSIFENTVVLKSNEIAVISGNINMSYRELNQRSNQLARTLRENGLKPNDIVGLMSFRSVEMIIGIISIMKAGGAYLPISPEYPVDRINYIIDNSKIQTILVETKDMVSLLKNKVTTFCLKNNDIYCKDNSNLEKINSSNDLAYVIYTSGSTGKPKGVMINHIALINRLIWMQKKYPLDAEDTILQKTTFTFDVSVWELIWGFFTGSKLCFLEPEGEKYPDKIIEEIYQNKITTIHFVPSMLNAFLDYIEAHREKVKELQSLIRVFASGETLNVIQVQRFYNCLYKENGTKLINLYGPTEAAIDVTYYDCFKHTNWNVIPIGKPIDNMKIFIVDKNNNIQPIGVSGELCISGIGLAAGYLNNLELTNEKFVACPFLSGKIMYKTGDIARWSFNGELEYLGRMDQQIKIRGLRIELGEIEHVLMKNSKIKDAVVMALQRKNGDNFLCAYLVKNCEVDLEEIKHYLRNKIPNYMVPSYFVFMDKLPLSFNGKIDRKKLPNPLFNESVFNDRKEPNSHTEQIVLNIWKKVLEVDNIGLNQNFFEIGGNSILLLRVHTMLEKLFPNKIKIIDLFEHHTIESLSIFIDSNKIEDSEKAKYETEEQEAGNAIAIIGISSKLGGTQSLIEFEHILESECNMIRPVSKQRQIDSLNYLSATGENIKNVKFSKGAYFDNIDQFDNEFFSISPNEAKLWDPMQRIFLQCAWEAIEDTGYGEDGFKGTKTGIFVGVSSSEIFDYKSLILKKYPTMAGMAVSGNLKPIIASRIAYILDLKGPNMILDTACSSSLVSLHLACKSINDGECSMAIAGGIKLNILPVERIHKMGIESSDGKTKAFEFDSDGTGDGEGCAVLVLKPLYQAIKDNDNIYATILGSAVNQDGNSIGITAPNVSAQRDVILEAWNKAKIDPRTVTFIEAHGTGTKLGDPIEIQGISKAFARFTEQKQFCAVSSVKTNIGHLDAAAGIAGIVKAIISLKNKKIYSNLHFCRPNKNIEFENSPVYIAKNIQDWIPYAKIRRCGVSSFGLSGTNCHIVLEEYINNTELDNQNDRNNYIFTLSAKNMDNLKKYIEDYILYFNTIKQDINIRDVCYTVNIGRTHYKYRVAVIVNSVSDLLGKLHMLINVDFMKFKSDWCFISGATEQKELIYCNNNINKPVPTQNSENLNKLEDLKMISKQYVSGIRILWKELYKDYQNHRLSLPTYPFLQSRHWMKEQHNKIHQEKVYYKEVWKEKENNERKTNIKFTTLIVHENNCCYESIISTLSMMNNNMIEIIIGDKYKKITENKYIIYPIQSYFEKIFHEIEVNAITNIIYLTSSLKSEEIKNIEELVECQDKGIYCMHSMIRALSTRIVNKHFKISLISKFANIVTNNEETIYFADAPLVGYMKVLCNEYTNITCQCVDMDSEKEIDNVVYEIYSNSKDYNVAFRNGTRFAKELECIELDKYLGLDRKIKKNGVYIIFGGSGGIGFELAKNILNSNLNPFVLLVGRRHTKQLSELQSQFINNHTRNICYVSGDVTDGAWLSSFLDNTRINYNAITGIINCAGISGHGYIPNKNISDMKKVLSAKVMGTWNIYSMTEHDNLDFLILCSSATTLTGISGQSDYTAANSFLDSFAEFGKNKNKPILTINWSPWKETGMASEYGIDENNIFSPISSKLAIRLFNNLINSNIERVIVGELNFNGKINGKSIAHCKNSLSIDLSENLLKLFDFPNKERERLEHTSNVLLNGLKNFNNEEIYFKTVRIWKEVLGFEQFDMEDNFFEIGGNSIMLVRMQELIKEKLNINIAIGELFAYPTLSKLAGFLNSFNNPTYSVDVVSDKDSEMHLLVQQMVNGNISINEAADKFFSL